MRERKTRERGNWNIPLVLVRDKLRKQPPPLGQEIEAALDARRRREGRAEHRKQYVCPAGSLRAGEFVR
jgi:hypothetical protein